MLDLKNKSLGKFEVGEEIGRGSMGIVFLAHDPFSSRDVAIKVANPEQLQDPTGGKRYRKMFFHEAKVAGRLRHPNIVQVFDASLEDDFCYIVMEYIPGNKTLYDHSKHGQLLPLEDVVRIAFKCARALDYAHRNSVIHRDIKPRNILLTDDNDVKIADFSIALLFEPEATETQVHGYVGSPLYMSPEQIHEQTLNNRSDLFSLGITIYEMLTGKHPFAGDSLPAIIQKITDRPHVPVCEVRRDVPPVLGHIVDRCLMKNPEERYKTGLDLAADLSLVYSHIQLLEEDVSNDDKFERVKNLAFFNDFSEPEIWEVINASGWQEHNPDTRIITEGDIDNSFYIMVAGEAEVRKGDQPVHTLQQGDCFGEMGFIAGTERTASIVTCNPVTTMKVRASLIERASLQCQLRFHKVFLTTLVERLSNTTTRMSQSRHSGV